MAGGSSGRGASSISTMERDTEGAGRGGWGAGGPTAGVTTTLPLQGGGEEVQKGDGEGEKSEVWYLVVVCDLEAVVGGRGWRGRETTGLTLVTPAMLRLLAMPSLRMIWVPGVMGVPGGGAEVKTDPGAA